MCELWCLDCYIMPRLRNGDLYLASVNNNFAMVHTALCSKSR